MQKPLLGESGVFSPRRRRPPFFFLRLRIGKFTKNIFAGFCSRGKGFLPRRACALVVTVPLLAYAGHTRRPQGTRRPLWRVLCTRTHSDAAAGLLCYGQPLTRREAKSEISSLLSVLSW